MLPIMYANTKLQLKLTKQIAQKRYIIVYYKKKNQLKKNNHLFDV